MKRLHIVGIVLGVVLTIGGLLVLASCLTIQPVATPPQQPYSYGPGGGTVPGTVGPGYGTGPGMMGPGYGTSPGTTTPGYGSGPGMMGPGYGTSPGTTTPGYGSSPGMMGPGYGSGPGAMGQGMMGGGWSNYNPDAKPVTIDQAADVARRYLNAYGGNLTLTEAMDFAWNFYAEAKEEDTGIHAMELLIDKHTGQVYPEMGPNMMWNTKYGIMGGRFSEPTATMPVNAEQAKTIAQQYLDNNLSGLTAAEADTFYGYYTLHTLKDGQIVGMLSVNGYNGAVWYHTWHGPFITMKEFE
jgi:hypothetical protein